MLSQTAENPRYIELKSLKFVHFKKTIVIAIRDRFMRSLRAVAASNPTCSLWLLVGPEAAAETPLRCIAACWSCVVPMLILLELGERQEDLLKRRLALQHHTTKARQGTD